MPSVLSTMLCGSLTLCSGLVLPTAPRVHSPRASALRMVDANQDGKPTNSLKGPGEVQFDNDMSGWKPDMQPGSKHTMSGGFESTDTPDFLPDEERHNKIEFTDGLMGSQNDGSKKDRNMDPGVAGALEVNPEIYVPDALEIVADASNFVMKNKEMTDLDFEMFIDSGSDSKSITVDVRPVMMTYEDYYCGFTADSHPSFSVSPDSGAMEKRNGAPTQLTVTCTPGAGDKGTLEAWLCFILPDEKAFSSYYKITAEAR